MKSHRILRSLTALLLASSAAWLTAQSSVVPSQAIAAPLHAVRPNLGWLTVRPKRARIGQLVTISGRTKGFIQFLPPFVLLQNTRTMVVNYGLGPCGGREVVPVVDKVVNKGGGVGAPGSRQNPPTGTAWQARFDVPAKMNAPYGDRRSRTVPTPPGTYSIVAIAAGMDGPCGLLTKSSTFISVNTLTVVR